MSQHLHSSRKNLMLLALTCLGVVYGDLGTSPLYAIRECFAESQGVGVDPFNIFGVLSLIFWSLLLVIGLKYLVIILRADNQGEGGVLALMTLAHSDHEETPPRRGGSLLVFLGLFGAALLYGDGMITPAISVLSAMEGLTVATPVFEPYVIPLTLLVLVALFSSQYHGTEKVGAVFGPIILVWFSALALLGLRGISEHPAILQALSPHWAVAFLFNHGWKSLQVLGAVFLAVTGAEALYADMGHFGVRPIRLGWFWVAFPALLLNYFGQGALLLKDPSKVTNPFFALAPSWALYPLIFIATLATIIASQAVISGTFSLTNQAIQLGYLPRMIVKHTSEQERGQIYVPKVNWMLFALTLWLVLTFKSSTNLAAAYGFAVSTTMVITTILVFVVTRQLWKWSLTKSLSILVPLFFVDIVFFSANILKVKDGGWFPLLVGLILFSVMTTWRTGRRLLFGLIQRKTPLLIHYEKELVNNPPTVVPGTAIYMVARKEHVPPAFSHNLKHNKIMHKNIFIVSVETQDTPHVERQDQIAITRKSNFFTSITLRYGFKDRPNVPRALRQAQREGLDIDVDHATYFLGRETLIATSKRGMALWREVLFTFLSRNAQGATSFYKIPSERVIEIGMQIEL